MIDISTHGTWNFPTLIVAGRGRIRELPALCSQIGIHRPLLVTDPVLSKLPMVRDVLSMCRDAGTVCSLFSDVKSNPSSTNVDSGVAAYRSGGHDGIVALGGGSSIDAAKAIALMAGQNLPLWAFEDVNENWRKADVNGICPVIAIPSTAGTGSEVGRASVIVDEEEHTKKIIFHPRMMPAAAILDPELTLGLPPPLTAATGMDALSHNLEAYCSPSYHPLADGIAMEGCRLIKNNLQTAFTDGSNMESRSQMLAAASMGAIAFQKGLGAMHALAHPLGALYDSHHGMLNAVLMPYVLRANRTSIEARIARLARFLNLHSANFDAFLEWVLELRQALEIPNTLAELGIDDLQAERIGILATLDPAAGGNPIQFTAADYEGIFRNALSGV